ncbi:MAG: hypothetical protein Q4F07_03240, partial [Bacteroidales bacterium]|nr:hypothetical protein [Bacteroidales bacterium]
MTTETQRLLCAISSPAARRATYIPEQYSSHILLCAFMALQGEIPVFFEKFVKKILKNLVIRKKCVTLQRFRRERALSSAGSERLPYKQRVG